MGKYSFVGEEEVERVEELELGSLLVFRYAHMPFARY